MSGLIFDFERISGEVATRYTNNPGIGSKFKKRPPTTSSDGIDARRRPPTAATPRNAEIFITRRLYGKFDEFEKSALSREAKKKQREEEERKEREEAERRALEAGDDALV